METWHGGKIAGRLIVLAVIATAAAGMVLSGRTADVLEFMMDRWKGPLAPAVLPLLLLCAAGIAAATLPKVLAANLVVFTCSLALLELGTWTVSRSRPAVSGEPVAVGAPRFYTPHRTLGYVMVPSVTARHRRTIGTQEIYDVVYRTDVWARRETPAAGPREGFLLFFGDSNTFGEGLAQSETLPYYAGEFAREYRPYNYGVPGYGPSQMLALARGDLVRQVPERHGYAIFLLIPAHVSRVIGSSTVSTTWGRHFPYFVENGRGQLIHKGNFLEGRPLTTLAYLFAAKSQLLDYFGVELPLRYTASDYRLVARIFKESSDLLARQFHLRGFFVVIAQAYNAAQLTVLENARDALAREGVPYLDYTTLLDTRDPKNRLAELDYHNSALANQAIARRLVADLRACEDAGRCPPPSATFGNSPLRVARTGNTS